MAWPRDLEDALKRHWEDGKTASQISALLPDMPSKHGPPRPITRDMVIGKARRMGLSRRPSPIKRQTA